MSGITVELRGISGSVTLEVPEDATIADVRSEAGLNDGLAIRADGVSIDRDEEDSTPVRDEQVLVSTPPAAKHG